MDFDYFYNREAERFNFLKVPEILVVILYLSYFKANCNYSV